MRGESSGRLRANRRESGRIPQVATLILSLALSGASRQAPDTGYVRDFESWKAELVKDRRENWLVLAGLFWLKPGANRFGSSPEDAIVLPSGAAHAGVFRLEGDEVEVTLNPGVDATINREKKNSAKMDSDATGHPTVIAIGSLRLHLIRRGARLGIRLKDLNRPAARDYSGPSFFPIDLDYRVTASFVASDGKKTVDVPNVLGDSTPTPVPGEVRFELSGHELRLTALSGEPEKGLSFVFSDLTSKTDTYPGGRFLDTGPVVDGKVELDFNRAYSPPCSVTAYATCPLAPLENRLSVTIPAGEKYQRGHGGD